MQVRDPCHARHRQSQLEQDLLFQKNLSTLVQSLPFPVILDTSSLATNVAYRKPISHSSNAPGGGGSLTTDGDSSPVHDGGPCFMTRAESSPWWRVDLVRPYSVRVVRISTTAGEELPALHDLEIRVGNHSRVRDNSLCAWHPGELSKCCQFELKMKGRRGEKQGKQIHEGFLKPEEIPRDERVERNPIQLIKSGVSNFVCARPMVGRYVFIQMTGADGQLILCEVEVFTTEEFSAESCSSNSDSHAVVFNQTCYDFQVSKKGTFDTARKECNDSGGDLIYKFNEITFDFVKSELERIKNQLQNKLIWIGAQKDPGFISRTWRWVTTREEIAEPMWGRAQPNNYNGEQNCVVLDGNHAWLWNDVGCNLDYLHWICQLNPTDCGSPERRENTTVDSTNYSVGSVITYQCPQDSKVVGDRQRKCLPSGMWSGFAPTCQFVDCGPLGTIENGVVTLIEDRTTYNATAHYFCSENHTLSGEETRHCQADGTWSGKDPRCLYKWCPPLDAPANGTVEIPSFEAGSVARFKCPPGHILIGQDSATYCGVPPPLNEGVRQLLNGSTNVGSIVEYQCQEDYWLVGPQRRVCLASSLWSDSAPYCKLITCGEPEVPPGAIVTGPNFNVNSIILYSCEPGNFLVGRSERICTHEGKWSGDASYCEFVDCGRIQPILKGTISYLNETTFLGSVVQYTCSRNYRLLGQSQRVCPRDGHWSGDAPTCEEIRCGEPERPQNSVVNIRGNDRTKNVVRSRATASGPGGQGNLPLVTYRIGATVTYACEAGYKVEGRLIRQCENTGLWTGEPPTCIYVDCGAPERIENGGFTLPQNATYYSATALYFCNENFRLVGKETRKCEGNGTWSDDLPSCSEILCREPERTETIFNVVVDGYDVGGQATYSCATGQMMKGSATRTCQATGVWSGLPPHCEWVDCGDPGKVENGRVYQINQSTIYNSVVEYSCFPKYRLKGVFSRRCTAEGSWEDSAPTCELEEVPYDILGDNTIEGAQNVPAGRSGGGDTRRAGGPKNETPNGAVMKRPGEEPPNPNVMSFATFRESQRPNIHDDGDDDGGYDVVNEGDSPYPVTNGHTRQTGGYSNSSYSASPPSTASFHGSSGGTVTINGVALR
ncbi:unnamed protein product [Darwinula stevensoni]|uniref:Uncharacterized protein n=1 Tax=Darwinula stevensoni TaxID=69355 RepID=A0A7R9A478_9CRUS|nr:unnamed protein product [Darwinula stevensoni]CAG0889424.1 unnamed protein product [Darwinula stevensoni]